MNLHRSQRVKLAIFVILLSAFPRLSVARGFLNAPVYHTGRQPQGVVTADFNSDGHVDLAAVDYGDQGVSVLLGRNDGSFEAPLKSPAGRLPVFLAEGDLNADGKADLVLINQLRTGDNGYLSVLLGQGDGTFQLPTSLFAGPKPHSVVATDLNGDGNLDLVAVNAVLDGTVGVLLGNGDGSFQPPARYAAGTWANALVAADFNRDGKLDLAVANYEGGGSVSILLGNGDGSLQPPTSYLVGESASFVAVGDLDGDGNLDLAVANGQDSFISLLFGNGDGSFQSAKNLTLGFQVSPHDIVIADLDTDEKLDLAVSTGISGDLRLLLGNGDGTFKVPLSYELTGFSLAGADLDGDGNLDFATTYSGITEQDDGVAILLGNGDGTFRTARTFIAGFGLFSVASGDFNLDGKPDLVTSNAFDPRPDVSVLLGKGDGSFRPRVSYRTGPDASYVTVSDINVDGKPDLAVAADDGVSVLLGNGDGSFQQPPIHSELVSSTDFLAAGDFNGDGKPDVAALGFVDMAIAVGNGDGSFQPPVTYPGGASLATGDFNRDGKLDVVVSTPDGNAIGLGNGDGTLLRAGTYPGGWGKVVVADFSRDGKLDLATTDAATDTIAVLVGNGDGSFQSAVAYGLYQAEDLVILDINGDGKLDLVGSALVANNLGVLFGNGDGTFRKVVNVPVEGPLNLATSELNRDRAPDLIFTTAGNTITVLLNNGGTFPSTISSLNPSKLGQPVTFTTTVAPTFAFMGTPTGTVTFRDGNKLLGKVTLSGGQASLTTSELGLGNHTIQTSYSGDSTFNPNQTPPFVQKVIP